MNKYEEIISLLKDKKNVVYYCLEKPEEYILKNLYSILCGISVEEIIKNENLIKEKLKELKDDGGGKLIIKRFVSEYKKEHFVSHLNKLKEEKDFVPDVVVIDKIQNIDVFNSYDEFMNEKLFF